MGSHNPDKGWGFIDCTATHKKYEKDIFLMHTREKGVKVNAGDRVRFTVQDGAKGPEVNELEVINSEGEEIDQPFPERQRESTGKKVQSAPKGKGPPPPKGSFETDGMTYTGKIKSFNEKRGWGFIQCAETEETYGKDIIVHHHNVGAMNFTVGEEVR